MELNIRNEKDRTAIENAGFSWVVVVPRGENKGQVTSRHRTYDAANKAARGHDRAIVGMDAARDY